MQAEPERRFLEDRARRLDRHRRHREGFGARRVEGPRRAGDANLPVDPRVVGLEFGVVDRPVGEVGAADRAEHAALVEVDFAKAPVVAAEVHAAAADGLRVFRRLAEPRHLGRFRLVVAESLPRGLRRAAEQFAFEKDVDLVVGEIAGLPERALFEHHDAHAFCRKLACKDAARRA